VRGDVAKTGADDCSGVSSRRLDRRRRQRGIDGQVNQIGLAKAAYRTEQATSGTDEVEKAVPLEWDGLPGATNRQRLVLLEPSVEVGSQRLGIQ